ncbi:hypothetical protein K431DRAFT_10115 [Polychaeton citri CBS 116435]|uniref:Uncharacterized protein n=1 Tax=Polychaeton citri CBS 116435 TaxID=1314669 RepID=A0A9P4URH4_9PEZI|nr:hypothetical protein K431DRAFT_10115 [Polychaeton citri CBS 116435]
MARSCHRRRQQQGGRQWPMKGRSAYSRQIHVESSRTLGVEMLRLQWGRVNCDTIKAVPVPLPLPLLLPLQPEAFREKLVAACRLLPAACCACSMVGHLERRSADTGLRLLLTCRSTMPGALHRCRRPAYHGGYDSRLCWGI